MQRFRLFVFLALGLMLGLSACSSSRQGLLKLYQRNSGDIINLRVGEEVQVVLDGDPSFEIQWITPTDDPGILKQVGGTEYVTDLETHDARRQLMVRFRAVETGRTRLQLTYRDPAAGRPNTQITPDKVFDVWVVVK